MRTLENKELDSIASAIKSGLEYARECLAVHEKALGRSIPKNKKWAEMIENDIQRMEHALDVLRKILVMEGG